MKILKNKKLGKVASETKRNLKSLFKKIKIPKFLKVILLAISAFAALVAIVIFCLGDSNFRGSIDNTLVNDVTGLNPINVGKIVQPTSLEEIVEAISSTSGPVSIGGGRFSQGGQTAYQDSLHLDMRKYNKILNVSDHEITVQSGATWHDIQDHVDALNLSVHTMQTYANFTVGGSLSVNSHGRYMGHGPLVSSVKSIKVILANGSVTTATPTKNSEIFYGVIGGYGGLGVIAEVTLKLDDNTKIERRTKKMKISEYQDYFFKNIRDHKEIVFHNGDIYTPDYETVNDVSWYVTDKPLTKKERLIPKDRKYFWEPKLVELVSSSSLMKWVRQYVVEPLYYSKERVVWRNWEANYDVAELEPSSREKYTYVLREYFVPAEKFNEFYPKMRDIFQKYDVNVINVSIRHANQDPGTLLAWARHEVFAFVVYYKQGTDKAAKEAVGKWDREMIDAAIEVGGAYYLPYQIFASDEQFLKAYPRAKEYFQLKEKLDPNNRFINKLWEAYYPKNKVGLNHKAKDIKQYFRGEEQTFLTLPEWYLVFNPKEYADYLEAGKNPSNFPFFASLDEYWSLYDRIRFLTKRVYPENSEYLTMLHVIGVSTTVEYMVKSAYENTIGRFTRWLANDEDVEEDKLIAKAQREYSNLIYDKAWYEFNFYSWVKKIWSDTDFFGNNFIRKIERKIFFTAEFGFKSIYAKLIGFASKATYEKSDGLIYMKAEASNAEAFRVDDRITIIAQEKNKYLISIPRWNPFTHILPKLASKNVKFLDISGNDEILVTVLSNKGAPKPSCGKLLFESRVVSDSSKKRLVLQTKVEELSKCLNSYRTYFGYIEHIYDY
jgi:FAD/FMN-containing dehydrogenase